MSEALKEFNRIGEFDPQPILAEINALPVWNWLNLRRLFPGSEHGSVDDIVLRFAPVDRALSVESVFNDLECVNYFPWFAMSCVRELVEKYRLPTQTIGRVVIASLKPGGIINWHRDEGVYSDSHIRIHFAVTSEPTCTFHCGGEAAVMAPGEVWEFNHHNIHSVVNASASPRIHIIADYRENE